ncbi:Fe-Mn family superoxide dismutase [Salinicola acroporae]|uniref:Fe-Mn family superoxide dismutase n=1 Tax=Salinicola acroporae TaxID=1541440 RepID=UPI0013A622F8|nr:Fe-Mn family superoxide dismutase [Salinicola acroporae]
MPEFATRFELPALPFERHSLEPEVSRAQVDLLYSHYHRRHIDALNAREPRLPGRSLASLAEHDEDEIRRSAQEAWNLVFFWHGLSGVGVAMPDGLARRIDQAFGGPGALQHRWRASIQDVSEGWSWLAVDADGKLELRHSPTGARPPEVAPLLAIALNEDAYRIDYPQRRGEYFDALWPHLNWEYAQLNIEASV